MIPEATYRLQFHKDFGFDAAADVAPYLAALGVSHVYASSYLKARPGSTHGYDIVDHHTLNPELGDEAAFERMVSAFKTHGLRQILDFVPNHMGVGGADNPLWLDVLEWGPDSVHAGWFDIDWGHDRRAVSNKLLVPFLGDQYGIELERGQLELRFDQGTGCFAVWAYDTHKLPICPLHYGEILSDAHPELERLGDAFAGLLDWRPQVPRRATELKSALADAARERPEIDHAVASALAGLNGQPGDAPSWSALNALIQKQYWRAAHFRVAGDDINYRRFFNINDLAGLRMELPEVFDHAHRFVFRLLHEGIIDGLRIDHVDGLMDPKAYLTTLRQKAAGERGDQGPFYLVVEKILARHEFLREDWPVDGTTGYDFTNLVLGLLVDPAGEEPFTRLYEEFTGQRLPFGQIVRECKRRIMKNEMASELNVLAREAARVASQNPRSADFTHNLLHRALEEIVACFPVYRTYVDGDRLSTERDDQDRDWALAQARRNETDIDPSVFDFLERMLSGELVAQPRSGFSRHAALRCAMKFQQYSGPVMAKGLEDTAFYRYYRFLALNEVGGHPDHFGVSLSAFHKANAHRAKHWPHAMLGTSTHDTKRGEDTRARLAVLSELPEEWARQVPAWSRILRARRGDVEGIAPPDRNDEYLFYQLLVGTWPPGLTLEAVGSDGLRDYTDRLKKTLVKSMREAKVYSTWTAPNTEYEEAMLGFVDDALKPDKSNLFLAAFLPFQQNVARLGVENSLVQTVMKLTLPGMPDIYQGADLWDLSMVDPDNRRPVDYLARRQLLQVIQDEAQTGRVGSIRARREAWHDGSIKLAITHTLLQLRRTLPDLFQHGTYDPCPVVGDGQERVCAFARQYENQTVVVAALRFPATHEKNDRVCEARVTGPLAPVSTPWRDVLTDKLYDAVEWEAQSLFAELPVAVLVARGKPS